MLACPFLYCFALQIIRDTYGDGKDRTIVDFYLDGAHTPESLTACAHWFADCSTPAADANREPLTGLPYLLVSVLQDAACLQCASCSQFTALNDTAGNKAHT